MTRLCTEPVLAQWKIEKHDKQSKCLQPRLNVLACSHAQDDAVSINGVRPMIHISWLRVAVHTFRDAVSHVMVIHEISHRRKCECDS